jgi:CheY-like chemotaxis protein
VDLEDDDTWPGADVPRRPIRILLVDDNVNFRRQSTRFIAAVPFCRIVAYAASGREAVEMERKTAPDLVLMDWMMPEMDGFEAARRIKARPGAALVVIMSLDAASLEGAAPDPATVDGFISKTNFVRELESVLTRLFPLPGGPGGSAA